MRERIATRLRSVGWIVQTVRTVRRWRLLQEQRAWDWRYGIRTLHTPGDEFDRAPVQYEPTKYAAIHACLAQLLLAPDDVVFDIGCGMGRVTCLFARQPVTRCVGIERVGRLAEIARLNASRVYGRRASVEIRTEDAGQTDYAGGTVFWLYNPFGDETMRRTLARIKASVEAAPRPIQIIYAAPHYESAFYDGNWLDRKFAIEVQYDLVQTMPVSFWINRPLRSDTIQAGSDGYGHDHQAFDLH
jgi:predicted RNA methylase